MFGNAMAVREQAHDLWGFPSVDTLVQDVRYGARLLRRSPIVTIAAILSLAIGIGATSLRESRPPTMYVAYRQQRAGSMTLEVRTAGDPLAFPPTARDIVRRVNANVPMFRAQSQAQQIELSVSRQRLLSKLVA